MPRPPTLETMGIGNARWTSVSTRGSVSRWGHVSVAACGLAACSADTPAEDAAAPDVADWVRCCEAAAPVGIATRTGGDGQLLCLCEGPTACNYWNYLCEDAGAASDAGPVSDTGFADVEPMDASALDALITNDTSGG